MNFKLSLPGFLWILSSPLWALPSPEIISQSVIQPDDPLQVNSQISAAMMLSFYNLYPDLTAMGITPVQGSSTTRLTNPGSSMIPDISSNLFTAEGIGVLEHTDLSGLPAK